MSVSPDEGMMLLQQRMHRSDIAPPDEAAPAGVEVSGELGIMLRLAAAVEANTAMLRKPRRRFTWEEVHPIALHPLANSAAGTLGLGDERWSPRAGWVWDVRRISVVFGAGATSAVIALDSAAGPWNVDTVDPPAVGNTTPWYFSGKTFLIMPSQYILVTSVGGGITINGQGIEIAISALPDYLS